MNNKKEFKKEFNEIKIEIFEVNQDIILYSLAIDNFIDGLQEDDSFFNEDN